MVVAVGLALAAVAATASGCTNYAYVVRTDNAPLYDDPDRAHVIARMERLEDGYIGHRRPKGDPIKIHYRDVVGWAERKDLRTFHYPNDDHARFHAVFYNRREVVLEGKDWPQNLKDAIRENRVENGMTKEMVELAWGKPTAVRTLEGGGEQWTYERRRYEVYEDVDYAYFPGGTSFYYGFGRWGPSWGFAYEFPLYEPRYYRTYYARTERRTVTFNAAGGVTGWEQMGS